MKINVLGCSHSWTTRYTSCYLVNDNILIDCGLDAYKAYIKTGKPFDDIDLFLITHFHADHTFGLNVFLTQIQKKHKNLQKKVTVVGHKGIRKLCEFVFEACNLFHFDFGPYINFVELDDGQSIDFEDIHITAYKLDHGDVEDIGYVLTQNGKSFGYTGDTTYLPALDDFIERCDLCFVEVSRIKTDFKHLGTDKFDELLEKHRDTKLLGVHCDEEIYVMEKYKDKLVRENDIFEV